MNLVSSDREKLERAIIAQTAKILSSKECWDRTDWRITLEMFMFSHLLNKVSRLIRSQFFHDEDYPDNVFWVLKNAYEENPQMAIQMIRYILEELKEQLGEGIFTRYPLVKAFLEKSEIFDQSVIFSVTEAEYLAISDVPDPFYRDLIDLINKCYSYGIYPAVLVFNRKLLENLLVDILRKKYGTQNVELFFDTKRRRFRSFNELLKNFEENLDDFIPIIPHLNSNFIKKVNIFREAGNSSAHTFELNIQRSWLDENRDDLEYVVKTLIRLYNNITP